MSDRNGQSGRVRLFMERLRSFVHPLIILIVFESVAVSLWLTRNNLFYLLNFTYIGLSVALGILLFNLKYRYARRIVQLLVGLYMLVYLGLICRENMQIEGFWYYLFSGVFEAATIHYAVAKIFGPLVAGQPWCWIFCHIRFRQDKGERSAGSGISLLPCHLPLYRPCFFRAREIWIISCSFHLSPEMLFTTQSEFRLPSSSGITGLSASISVRSQCS